MFCNTTVSFDVLKHGGKTEGFKVEMHEFTKTIKACCDARGDEWACNVKGKTLFTTDHVVSIFEQIDKYQYCPDAKKGNSGRPENPMLRDACTDFETHEEEQ